MSVAPANRQLGLLDKSLHLGTNAATRAMTAKQNDAQLRPSAKEPPVTSLAEKTPPNAPAQRFATEGIKPLARASLVARAFMRIVGFVERLNVTFSKVGNPPIYDNAVFPWTTDVEGEWRAIRAELDRVLLRQADLPGFHELSTDVATISQDRGWKTFFLSGYGFKSDANIKKCPETWRICQKIPGLITVMFSILEPGKHLPPHRGPYNGVLRLHLGLIVPEPREQLGIRVEHDVYRWKEGEAVIFDDAYEHEAWNKTPHTRVVLFVDFRKPLRFPANFLNWLLLSLAIFTPFIREGMDNQKAWEKKFYEEAEALRNG
jgi:aspartyl/asparaginyl beta-hydroxylase (cupin superfamily)